MAVASELSDWLGSRNHCLETSAELSGFGVVPECRNGADWNGLGWVDVKGGDGTLEARQGNGRGA